MIFGFIHFENKTFETHITSLYIRTRNRYYLKLMLTNTMTYSLVHTSSSEIVGWFCILCYDGEPSMETIKLSKKSVRQEIFKKSFK